MTNIEPSTPTLHELAFALAPGLGNPAKRQLLRRFATPEQLLGASDRALRESGLISSRKIKSLRDPALHERARQEQAFLRRHGFGAVFIDHPAYPERLALCEDAPVLLYCSGAPALNASKIIAVVGTRSNTAYGQQLCESVLQELSALPGLSVVSGMAAGIDGIAHRACLRLPVPTVGVVAHSLEYLYPHAHRGLAQQMRRAPGCGLVSEFPSGTRPHRGNFPLRNRIVAGLADLTLVVESRSRGGALITARLAQGYHREVAAFPGRVTDAASEGCLQLIREHTAALVTGGGAVSELMNWNAPSPVPALQARLFGQLSERQAALVTLVQQRGQAHADELLGSLGWNSGVLAAELLELQLAGLIVPKPGNRYALSGLHRC